MMISTDNNSYTGRLRRFQYKRVYFFLPSVLGDTRRETRFIKAYTNHTMLTPTTHGESCGVKDLNSSFPVEPQTDLIWSDPKNPTACNNGRTSIQVFFKIPKFSGSYLPGMTSTTHSIHSSPISCLEVYYHIWWLSYPFHVGMRVPRLTATPKLETLSSSKPYQTK